MWRDRTIIAICLWQTPRCCGVWHAWFVPLLKRSRLHYVFKKPNNMVSPGGWVPRLCFQARGWLSPARHSTAGTPQFSPNVGSIRRSPQAFRAASFRNTACSEAKPRDALGAVVKFYSPLGLLADLPPTAPTPRTTRIAHHAVSPTGAWSSSGAGRNT